jgi:cell division protein FtsL
MGRQANSMDEATQHTETKKSRAPKNNWLRLMSTRWIMKNMIFFLFLAALAVIYIYNGHYADNIVREINHTNRELKELQYEYKTLKSEVMFRSKQSELAKAVAPFGLKELTAPPYALVDSAQ